MTTATKRIYEARMTIPADERKLITFGSFEKMLEKIREVGGAEPKYNADHVPTSVLITFEAADLYELAMKVRDLEMELNAGVHMYNSVYNIPRPKVSKRTTL